MNSNISIQEPEINAPAFIGQQLSILSHVIFVTLEQATELNNALRMFVTSLLSSTLVPRVEILSASAMDRSSELWKICVSY